MYSFPDFTLPPPEARAPLTWQTASTTILPSLLLYYLAAYLVLTPGTLPLRLALLPVSLWSFFRTATAVDLVHDFKQREGLVYLNKGLVLFMTITAGRCITWSYQPTPYKRLYRVPGEKGYKENRLSEALDLATNLRGLGWSWSRSRRLPPETRPTDSRSAFFLATLVDFVKWVVVGDHLHWVVQWIGPTTFGSPAGGSIYYSSLPPIQNFLVSTSFVLLIGAIIYTAIQSAYHFCTLIGIGLFGQHPLQWPPIFESVWMATSLTDFWTNRWHQLFRDLFISVGSRPLSKLFGRIGVVLGAFLASATFHSLGMWGLGRGAEFSTVGAFFLVQACGIILEHIWARLTGSRVGGPLGWIWTAGWVFIGGRLIIDAYCRKGIGASIFHLDRFRPSYLTLGRLPLPL